MSAIVMMRASRGDPLQMLYGATWSGALLRGGLLFLVGYVLPRVLAGHAVVMAQWPALLGCFLLVALAIYRFLPGNVSSRTETPAYVPDAADAHTVFDESFFPPAQKKKTVVPAQWSAELLRALEWRRMTDVVLAFYRFKGLYGRFELAEADGSVFIPLRKAADAVDAQPQALLHCVHDTAAVGEAAIYALAARMRVLGVSKAFFTGAASFDAAARAAAAPLQITLIDDRLFLSMLGRLPPQESQRLLELAVEGDYKTPTCPACLLKMIVRQGEQGRYWSCRAFPRCKQTLAAT